MGIDVTLSSLASLVTSLEATGGTVDITLTPTLAQLIRGGLSSGTIEVTVGSEGAKVRAVGGCPIFLIGNKITIDAMTAKALFSEALVASQSSTTLLAGTYTIDSDILGASQGTETLSGDTPGTPDFEAAQQPPIVLTARRTSTTPLVGATGPDLEMTGSSQVTETMTGDTDTSTSFEVTDC